MRLNHVFRSWQTLLSAGLQSNLSRWMKIFVFFQQGDEKVQSCIAEVNNSRG
jgi:hypothetical protein